MKSIIAFGLICFFIGLPVFAQTAESSGDSTAEPAVVDQAAATDEPAAPEYPEDETIKLRIEPVIVGNLVDRVSETARITVQTTGGSAVEVFALPVDCPYGGKPTGKATLIGRDAKPADGFSVQWKGPDSAEYFKIFAVVRKKSGKIVRSHSHDIAVAPPRFRPKSKADSKN